MDQLPDRGSVLSFWTSEMDSKPPPATIDMPSLTICFAAVAMAIMPEAHCRSTDMPATEEGNPARRAACRATLVTRRSLLQGRPDDHVVDFSTIHTGSADRVGDHVATQFLRLGIVEGTPIGLADRGTCR